MEKVISPKKSLFTVLLSKRESTREILLKGFFISKLLNNQLASCSLINFDFLLSHTAHFDKSSIRPIFVFITFGFLLFFLHFRQYDSTVL